MLTHDQTIFVLRSLYPQIGATDHGKHYLVGMPVDGDTQIGPAQIVRWDYDFEQPTPSQIETAWEDLAASFAYETKAQEIRSHRDVLLRDSDWAVTQSIEHAQPVPQAWIDYRQALRDITEQPGFPHDVIWPEAPDA